MNESGTDTRRVLGISISDSDELARYRLGQEHINELTVLVARICLKQQLSLAYGGDLRPGSFTQVIFNVAKGEDTGLKAWKDWLQSYLAWPLYNCLSVEQQAELISVCRFVKVTPDVAGFKQPVDDKPDLKNPSLREGEKSELVGRAVLRKAQSCRSLSTMRYIMQTGTTYEGIVVHAEDDRPANAIDARIIIGGPVKDYTGALPGLFEEFILAVEHDIPVLLVGGLGGAAKILADAVYGDEEPSFEGPLDEQYHYANTPDTKHIADSEHHELLKKLGDKGCSTKAMFERLQCAINTARGNGLHGWSDELKNNGDLKLLVDARGPENITRAIQHTITVLQSDRRST